jgi:hypothetical protein
MHFFASEAAHPNKGGEPTHWSANRVDSLPVVLNYQM